MKKIRLDVSKKTFEKYFLELGYEYKIIDFEMMIDKIQRDIYNKLSESTFEELEITIKNIFYNQKIISIFDKKKYNELNVSYFVSLLENRSLSVFLDNIDMKYSNHIQKQAYTLGYLDRYKNNNDITEFIRENDSLKFILRKSSSSFAKINNCLKNKLIYISKEEKEEISSNISFELNSYFINKSENNLISIYIEFIFYMVSKYKKFPDTQIIEDIFINTISNGQLTSYFFVIKDIKYSKIFDIFKKIRDDYHKSYQWSFDIYIELITTGDSKGLSEEIERLKSIPSRMNIQTLKSRFKNLLNSKEYLNDNNSFSLSYEGKEFYFNFEEMNLEYLELSNSL